eukprot:765700-Hanusia_phi.AAC.11
MGGRVGEEEGRGGEGRRGGEERRGEERRGEEEGRGEEGRVLAVDDSELRSRSEDKQNFIGAFKADEGYGMGVGGTTVNDCSKLYRLGFLRKVYGILTIQLVATAVICAMAMRIPGQVVQGKNAEYTVLAFGSFLAGSKGFQILVFILSIGVLLWLMFKKDSYPTNMILLSGW